MKIKLRAQYAYYMMMAWITNTIASGASKVLRSVGSASNRYESKAYSAQIDILKPR